SPPRAPPPSPPFPYTTLFRSIAIEPEVLLLDEPASALDPISTQRIEELIAELKVDYCIAMVTHNMQQAARSSDYTAFLYLGELRSEEHTSELQSRRDLVCRLL